MTVFGAFTKGEPYDARVSPTVLRADEGAVPSVDTHRLSTKRVDNSVSNN